MEEENLAATARKILNDPKYNEIKKKIIEFERRLEEMRNNKELAALNEEKVAFFRELKMKNRELYDVFALNEKILSEKLIKKITGEEILID